MGLLTTIAPLLVNEEFIQSGQHLQMLVDDGPALRLLVKESLEERDGLRQQDLSAAIDANSLASLKNPRINRQKPLVTAMEMVARACRKM